VNRFILIEKMIGCTGCGKTFLMDLFYECAPVAGKRRAHFNAFMLEVVLFSLAPLLALTGLLAGAQQNPQMARGQTQSIAKETRGREGR